MVVIIMVMISGYLSTQDFNNSIILGLYAS